jgi:hypothetical protein
MTDDVIERLGAAAAPTPPPLSPDLEAELAKLAPIAARRPGRQLAAVLALSLAYVGGLVAALALRRDLSELPAWWILGAGAAWLVGFVVPCYLALVPRAGAVMPRWHWAATSAIVTSVAFVALGWNVHPSGPSSAYNGWADLLRGRGCLWLGLVTAFVPVVAGVLFLRGALPVRSRWITAALGAGGGCLGGFFLHLHCPIADRYHVGLIHGTVVVVAALVTAAVAPLATDRQLARQEP